MASFLKKSALAMMLPLMAACTLIDGAQPKLSDQEPVKIGSITSDADRRTILSECSQHESPAFSGEVDDGFGMSIVVCVEPGHESDKPRISILYSGEGGGHAVSCLASACQGKIEFRHYRRYRFTELTLQWRDENGVQRLIETFDAQMDETNPRHSIHHRWARSHDEADIAAAESFPVSSDFAPLSLIVLDRYLNGEPAR